MSRKCTVILYFFSIVFTIGLITFIGVNFTHDNVRLCNTSRYAYDDGWQYYDANGELQDLVVPAKIETQDRWLHITNVTPEEYINGEAIMYRSRHQEIQVYIDGVLRYMFSANADNNLFQRTPGNATHIIDIYEADAGKQIDIYIRAVYGEKIELYNMFIGDRSGLIISLMQEHIDGLAVSILLVIVSIILVAGHFYISTAIKIGHSVLYLALFSIMVAMYSFSQTGLLQLVYGNQALYNFMDFTTFALIATPLFMYFDEYYKSRDVRFVRVCSNLSVFSYYILILLQVFNVADLKETVIVVHIEVGLMVVTAVYLTISESVIIYKREKIKSIMYAASALFLAGSAMYDLYSYYANKYEDFSKNSRRALLIYIVVLGIFAVKDSVQLIKLGMNARELERIAYKDVLSDAQNRNSYNVMCGYIDENFKKYPRLGIIMFDLNDLKIVNDTKGHTVGDTYIIQSSKLIEKSFSNMGNAYRIGGDEFAVICESFDESLYNSDVRTFNENIRKMNTSSKNEINISISYGYSVCDINNDKCIDDIIKRADANMYKDKINKKGGAR